MKTLGINVPKLAKQTENPKFYKQLGLTTGLFFDRETFGADKLSVGYGSLPFARVLADAPPACPRCKRSSAWHK